MYYNGLTNSGQTCQKPKLEAEVEFEAWLPQGKQDHILGAHTRTITAMRYSCDHLSMISEALETMYAILPVLCSSSSSE